MLITELTFWRKIFVKWTLCYYTNLIWMTFPRNYLKIDVCIGYMLVWHLIRCRQEHTCPWVFFLLGSAIRVKPEKIIFHNPSSISTGTDPITDRIDRYISHVEQTEARRDDRNKIHAGIGYFVGRKRVSSI